MYLNKYELFIENVAINFKNKFPRTASICSPLWRITRSSYLNKSKSESKKVVARKKVITNKPIPKSTLETRLFTLEKRMSDVDNLVFETMLTEKEQETTSLTTLWKMLLEASKVILPMLNIVGPEQLFKNICFVRFNDSNDEYKNADCAVLWGQHRDQTRSNIILQSKLNKVPLVLMEDGFIRSVCPDLKRDVPNKFRQGVSFIADMKRTHFDAFGPSMLEDLLNSDYNLTDSQLKRARNLISTIRKHKISKYNHQPIFTPEIGRHGVKKVLVIDQAVGDWSIRKGVEPATIFQKMLDTAVSENPHADIIIKVHPDMILAPHRGGGNNKYGHFTNISLEETTYRHNDLVHEHVYLFAEEINPISLLEYVDKIYVYSSQMGFEGLLCGKDVVIFGAPFYAGWGCADIRSQSNMLKRRKKNRTVEEIFYCAYIEYTRYIHPLKLEVCELEDTINILLDWRNEYFNTLTPSLFPEKNSKELSSVQPIDIIFSFDQNYFRQTTVAILSLLHASIGKCTYNIYCIHDIDVTETIQKEMESVVLQKSPDTTITFISSTIEHALHIERNISRATYARLLIPNLVPNLNKVLYSDVDVLFRKDLSPINSIAIGNYLLAACPDISLATNARYQHFIKTDSNWKKEFKNRRGRYFSAGFLLMNLERIRETKTDSQWEKHMHNKYHFQDMDVLNITCKDNIYPLPSEYCHIPADIKLNHHIEAGKIGILPKAYLNNYLHDPAIVHYAGKKPWDDKNTLKASLWWKFVAEHTPYYDYFANRYEATQTTK